MLRSPKERQRDRREADVGVRGLFTYLLIHGHTYVTVRSSTVAREFARDEYQGIGSFAETVDAKSSARALSRCSKSPRMPRRSDSTPASSANSSKDSSVNDASAELAAAAASASAASTLNSYSEASSSSSAPPIAEGSVLRHLRKRDTAAIAAWIDSGGNVNALDDQGRTLLMLAVSRVDVPTIHLLLRHMPPGAVDKQQRQGATALALASMLGAVEVCSQPRIKRAHPRPLK